MKNKKIRLELFAVSSLDYLFIFSSVFDCGAVLALDPCVQNGEKTSFSIQLSSRRAQTLRQSKWL